MKNIIITGSNGMVGSLVLRNVIERNDVKKVTSVTRRTTGIVHPKLIEVFHNDFANLSNIHDLFRNQDICFYCIGVYTGQVSREEFYRITVDFTKAFSTALRQQSPNATFCFLSGQGADQKEKSRIMFARDKGAAENILLNLQFSHTHIFRPGYIYPVTPRKEPNTMYRLMRILYKIFSRLFPNMGITSEKLARVIVDVGLSNTDKVIFENRDIRLFK